MFVVVGGSVGRMRWFYILEHRDDARSFFGGGCVKNSTSATMKVRICTNNRHLDGRIGTELTKTKQKKQQRYY